MDIPLFFFVVVCFALFYILWQMLLSKATYNRESRGSQCSSWVFKASVKDQMVKSLCWSCTFNRRLTNHGHSVWTCRTTYAKVTCLAEIIYKAVQLLQWAAHLIPASEFACYPPVCEGLHQQWRKICLGEVGSVTPPNVFPLTEHFEPSPSRRHF